MRKLIAIEFITLDGVIQSPGGKDEDTSGGFAQGGWISDYSDPTLSAILKGQMAMPFDLLLGRNTFDIWAPYWPLHNDVWPRVNSAIKYVASNTMDSHSWQPSIFINGDIPEKISELKSQKAADLHVYGSANLLQTLIKRDLVDEFWLKIYPITLGRGKRLFADGTVPASFKLTESRVTQRGVIIANYARADAITIRP